MEEGANIRMFLDAEGNIIRCEGFATVLEVKEEIAAQAAAGSVLATEDISGTVEVQIDSRKSEFIWVGKTQTEDDVRATENMLEFLATEKIAKALGDKKTHKAKLWEGVAEHLAASGYKIADSVKTAGIKCHQKWRNLERSYSTFIAHSSANGKGVRKPPMHFKQLHSILEKKHPALLPDKGEEKQRTVVKHIGQVETEGRVGEKILNTLQSFMQAEENRFEVLQDLLKKNFEAKKSFNRTFTQYLYFITKRSKKRRRYYDSSSS